MLDRRHFLHLSGAAGLTVAWPSLAGAAAPTENRLVFVILRGGLDGLHAVPPHGDADYYRLRPNLAVPAPGQAGGALDLDGSFGLHPALAPLHRLYNDGELLVVPAATSVYRDRSHFDGQNLLENGSGIPFGAKDGWLNRAIAQMSDGNRRLGLAMGAAVPLLLQGNARVVTWAESPLPKASEDFLKRLAYTYRHDALFARALAEAQGSMSPAMEPAAYRRSMRGKAVVTAAKAAAELLVRDDGPRVAVMEAQGWDTHFGQKRRLTGLFEQLSTGLVTLKDGLGDHWRRTAIIVVSEFGRTAAENGSNGTDHGVGGLALLLGGAVKGGRVLGPWPGLSQAALHEGRDLRPTVDYESLFKAMLIDHLHLSPASVEDKVFPNSRPLEPATDLFRST